MSATLGTLLVIRLIGSALLNSKARYWEEFCITANSRWHAGDKTFIARSLDDPSMPACIRKNICQMLFEPEIVAPPWWLQFENVISADTSPRTLVYVSEQLTRFEQKRGMNIETPNAMAFRRFLQRGVE